MEQLSCLVETAISVEARKTKPESKSHKARYHSAEATATTQTTICDRRYTDERRKSTRRVHFVISPGRCFAGDFLRRGNVGAWFEDGKPRVRNRRCALLRWRRWQGYVEADHRACAQKHPPVGKTDAIPHARRIRADDRRCADRLTTRRPGIRRAWQHAQLGAGGRMVRLHVRHGLFRQPRRPDKRSRQLDRAANQCRRSSGTVGGSSTSRIRAPASFPMP